jgi:hypothetical protein
MSNNYTMNVARFGPGIASVPAKLYFINHLENQASGLTFSSPLKAQVLDKFGNHVIIDNTTSILLEINLVEDELQDDPVTFDKKAPKPVLTGDVTVISSEGVATFDKVQLIRDPSYRGRTFVVASSGSLDKTETTVTIRPCKRGEVRAEGTVVCETCPPGTFSWATTETFTGKKCHPCPIGAIWYVVELFFCIYN